MVTRTACEEFLERAIPAVVRELTDRIYDQFRVYLLSRQLTVSMRMPYDDMIDDSATNHTAAREATKRLNFVLIRRPEIMRIIVVYIGQQTFVMAANADIIPTNPDARTI